ncbi:MAG: mannonate dehydratase [Planctomycetes bacterium]|nr:mannonate dehydratase [Planctomycetota bacterium]
MIKPMEIEPGMKIAAQASPEPTDEEIALIKQMGVEYVVLWTDSGKAGYEYYASRRDLFEKAGLKVYGLGNLDVHNEDAIVLNLPNRDEKIDQYKQHVRNLGKAGIPYATYAHMANGIWSTGRGQTRGGASARAFDVDKAQQGRWIKRRYNMPLSHGRKYSEEEIWDNYEYFIKQVVPVIEEAGVKIGIHPDDPPAVELAGVPRCIFGNFEGYRRAIEIADSPNVGVCLCVGCWLEGGELMGADVLDTIRYFGQRKKLFKVHLRNVTSPLPRFVETFLDEGYMNMHEVVRVLREVDFDGVLIPDHIPLMGGDMRIATAFSIGYMKALVERANADADRPGKT